MRTLPNGRGLNSGVRILRRDPEVLELPVRLRGVEAGRDLKRLAVIERCGAASQQPSQRVGVRTEPLPSHQRNSADRGVARPVPPS